MKRMAFESEHELFRDSARRFFTNEIGVHSQRWREQGSGDREAYLRGGVQGYLLRWADEEYGGVGYMAEYRICRMYTDAHVTRIFAGNNEIMKEIIGRGPASTKEKMT